MWINLWCINTLQNIHRGGIKIYNTMHSYFLFCIIKIRKFKYIYILDSHPIKILLLENLSKPIRTNSQMADC
jgi:hypothetical protein